MFISTLFSELTVGDATTNVLPITCIADYKSLFEAMKSSKFVTEMPVRIDISGIKELIQNGQIK